MAPAIASSREMHCLDCGYRLDHIPSTRCPECGRTFDPADPATTSSTRAWRQIERWSLGPSRILRPLVLIGTWIGIIASILLTGSRGISLLVLCLIFTFISVAYLPKKVIRWFTVRLHGMPRELLKVDRRTIWKCRRAFLIAGLLIVLRLPFLACFFASLPFLQRSALYEYEVAPATSERPTNTFIGLFPVQEVDVHYGGVSYHIYGGGALLYSEFPDRRPDAYRPLRHIWGNWHTMDLQIPDL